MKCHAKLRTHVALLLGMVLVFAVLIFSLAKKPEVERAELTFQPQGGLLLHGGEPFSGIAVECFSNGQLRERIPVRNGRRHGRVERWFADGHMESVSFYRAGRLHGVRNVWSPDAPHLLVSQSRHEAGIAEGEHRLWYPSGELYQIRQYQDGREAGLQRAFRKNGDLYANYEVRDGRTFGLRRANLCYTLNDESIELDP